jgi:NADH-quinone oxidoreductase subunit I
MYGQGVAKGLWVTLRHFIATFTDDVRYAGRKYMRQDNFEVRQGLRAQGAFTVQYPDEKLAVPERFRFVPFLITEDQDPARMGEDWCTSCGICAKVCPPQCIWIVRGSDPNTGRPVPQPTAFFIDIDICMNCGFCAEFCPFDAIKMDHDYELASYDRTSHHIHDKQKLSKPLSYWKNIAPTTALEEAVDRGGWEHTDIIKAMKKAGQTAEKPTVENMFKNVVTPTEAAPAQAAAPVAAAPVAAKPAAPAPAAPASKAEAAPAAGAGGKVKFDKAAMLAKIREKKAQKNQ